MKKDLSLYVCMYLSVCVHGCMCLKDRTQDSMCLYADEDGQGAKA